MLASISSLLIVGAQRAAADTCTNAAFRQGPSASLPDCRAYELVTPPFMNGQFPAASPQVGQDSSHLMFTTLGAPGEAGDDPTAFGARYAAVRTASGWSSTPLDPPASQYEQARSLGKGATAVSSDFGRSLIVPAALGGPVLPAEAPFREGIDARLVLHSPDGTFAEVGAILPPAAVTAYAEGAQESESPPSDWDLEGASKDLSHLLFASYQGSGAATNHKGEPLLNWHWPGDPTYFRAPSLYEYVGTGHTGVGADAPVLVGVDNERHVISQCGTGLGAGVGGEADSPLTPQDNHNAVSQDGSVLFFTAYGPNQVRGDGCTGPMPPAAELFARIGGSHTVAISEPTTTGPNADCVACDTAAPSDATFQGASEDGSRVFYLTEQALLPGAEGQGLYEYNFHAEEEGRASGERVTRLASNVDGVARVSEDGSHVYFVAHSVLTGAPNEQGQVAQAGQNNLYVDEPDPSHPGQPRLAYITTLAAADSEDWRSLDIRPLQATPDGRFLLFASTNDLTPDASGSGRQLYRYDAQSGELVRVTIGEAGFNNNGNALDLSVNLQPFPEPQWGLVRDHGPVQRAMSDDGSYVFFNSAVALTPKALNNACAFEQHGECLARAVNVYEYHNGHVYLISDGQDHHGVFGNTAVGLTGTTSSGGDVFFKSADPLVAQDTNTQLDIYDARIGGGFRAPATSAPCEAEACLGAPTTAPVAQLPGSATSSGPSNLLAAVSSPAVRPRSLTRAEKLAQALRACAKKPRRKRHACALQAKRKYGKASAPPYNRKHTGRGR